MDLTREMRAGKTAMPKLEKQLTDLETEMKLIETNIKDNEQEIINTNIDLGLDRVYLPTTMDLQWEQDVMNQCKQIVWIGCNDGLVQKDFKDKCIQIPNYYEFQINNEYRWMMDKIGYAARSETRKCFHFLDKHRGYACTDWMGYENLKEGLNLVSGI